MKNDQNVITNVTVEVIGTTEKAGKGIIAVYTKKDSTLKKVFFSKTNLEKGSTEGKYTLDFENEDLKVGEDEEMRVFVWAMDDEKGLTQQPLSDTYTYEEPKELPSTAIIGTLAANEKMFPQDEITIGDMAENLALTPNTEDASKIDVSGTIKYVESYTSIDEQYKTHYYLPFAVSGLNENTVVYLESNVGYTDTINDKTYKKITSANFDDDAKSLLYIVRAVDNDKKSFTVMVDLDGDGKEYAPTTYTFDLSELALEQVYNVTGTAKVYVRVNVTDENKEVGKVQYSADGATYTDTEKDENSRYYVFTMPASDVTVRALLMS